MKDEEDEQNKNGASARGADDDLKKPTPSEKGECFAKETSTLMKPSCDTVNQRDYIQSLETEPRQQEALRSIIPVAFSFEDDDNDSCPWDEHEICFDIQREVTALNEATQNNEDTECPIDDHDVVKETAIVSTKSDTSPRRNRRWILWVILLALIIAMGIGVGLGVTSSSSGTGSLSANALSWTPTSLPIQSPITSPSINTSQDILVTTKYPTILPIQSPIMSPSTNPSQDPILAATKYPTFLPSMSPSPNQFQAPIVASTENPKLSPIQSPSMSPSTNPSQAPIEAATENLTRSPIQSPTMFPSSNPSQAPIIVTTEYPTILPTQSPSTPPSSNQTQASIILPTESPTFFPTVTLPEKLPSISPSKSASVATTSPTFADTAEASVCSICGEGKTVGNPNAMFVYPGLPDAPCGQLDFAGKSGLIPMDFCSLIQMMIFSDASCQCS
mmetsp:Transcript_6515/g.10353  ORF Transcript_6515/g.10353 Transcript_6515/m.10353 type:complete len:446 (-) Transcript_6515:57-1394(-)